MSEPRAIHSVEQKPRSAHVIVLGNEKGGSGKSTMAMHIIVALLKAGRRVASIDTDSRQLSLTRYLEYRARWSRKTGLPLDLPTHFSVKSGEGETRSTIEAHEFKAFTEIVGRLGEAFDFVVIDTPANDSYRMRLSHAMADTLVTPINDSFVDLDVLGRVDPVDFAVVATSQYAELVRSARRERQLADSGATDWIVVRNRLSPLASRNQANVVEGLKRLSDLLEFRVADGVCERVVFREFFPMGLTAFDRIDRATLGGQPTVSHVAARREIRELIDCLELPGERPAAAPAVEERPSAARRLVAAD